MEIDLTKEHFAAIIYDSIFHEGDERSRTNPGHGYPAHTENILKYKPFKDREEMQKWIEKEEKSTYGKKKYHIISAVPMVVRTEIKVSFIHTPKQ